MNTTPSPNDAERLAAKQALAAATEVLANRVSSLADVVETNNQAIRDLRREVNQKPDDAEVKWITGMAAADRKVVRDRALATALISALVSGAVAFGIADYRSDKRCTQSQALSNEIAAFLLALPEPSPTLQDFTSRIEAAGRKGC